jgi:hypothetical protein
MVFVMLVANMVVDERGFEGHAVVLEGDEAIE